MNGDHTVGLPFLTEPVRPSTGVGMVPMVFLQWYILKDQRLQSVLTSRWHQIITIIKRRCVSPFIVWVDKSMAKGHGTYFMIFEHCTEIPKEISPTLIFQRLRMIHG
jgi:hypothetical protein